MKKVILLEHRKPVMKSLNKLRILFPNIIIWDPFPILCKTDICSAFDKNLPLFFDGDHLSAHGNRILYPSFLSIIKKIWKPDYKYTNGRIEFKQNSDGIKYLLNGWSQPEQWGIWSDDKSSLLRLDITSIIRSDIALLIDGHAFLAKKHPSQDINIIVNGKKISTLNYNLKFNNSIRELTIPKKLATKNNGHLMIRFDFKNPKSPSELGLSGDTRRLGLGLTSIEIKFKD